MKDLLLTVSRDQPSRRFQIHRLGRHETMRPGLVHRPQGTGDYLFMLFHDGAQIRSRLGDQEWPRSSLMIWTPKDGHCYGNTSGPWDHSWFHCAGRDIAGILKRNRIPANQPLALRDPSLLDRYLLETVSELNVWTGPDELILRNLFENFIRNLARHLFDRPGRCVPEVLLKIRAHVEAHFTEKLRLAGLARASGWSVPHLCTEFRRFFGVPVIQYVQQLRMNQAAYLLRDHNRRVGEIALLIGYPDLYTFSKMFKRSFGISPRHFRESAGKAAGPSDKKSPSF